MYSDEKSCKRSAAMLTHELYRRKTDTRRMPPLELPAAMLISLYVFACMTYLPLYRSEAFAGVLLLISVAVALLTLRSPWIIGMLSVFSFLLISLTDSLTVAALPIAMLGGSAYGAFLLLTVRSPWLIAIPGLSFTAALWITGDAALSLLAWLCLPAVVTLAYCIREGLPRVRAICRVAVAWILPLLLIGILGILLYRGAGTFLNLSAAVSAARQALARHLAAWETGTGENAGRVVLEGMEFALAGAIFNILPGTILAVLSVFSYLADLMCLTLFRTYERSRYLSRRVYILAISLPAAVLFLIGYLLILLFGDSHGAEMQFAAVVLENIYLTLLPAMLFAGALSCIRTFLLSSHRLMLLIGAILIIALSPATALTVLSLLGSGSVIWQAWKRKRRHPIDPKE